MPGLTYDQLSSITKEKFIPKLVNNIFLSNVLFMRMKEKGNYKSLDGGKKILQPIIYAQNTSGGWYTGSDSLVTTGVQTRTALAFDWKFQYQSITLNRTDILQNMGDSQVIDLVKAEVEIAEMTMKDRFGTGLFSAGTDANSITGSRVFGSVSNTYGGISQTTNSWLQAQVDSTTTTLSITALQTLYELASEDTDQPTIGVTTRTLYNKLYGQYQPAQRFMDSDVAKGGFRNLLFNGVPVVVDSHTPANNFHFYNEDYLQLYYHSQENFRFEDFLRIPTQNTNFAKIWWAGEYVCSSPRKQAFATALTA